MNSDNKIIAQTSQWIEAIVIGQNFCPFAKKVYENDSILFQAVNNKEIEECLTVLIEVCDQLENNNKCETAFLIYPDMFGDFDDYLDFVELANQLLVAEDFEGIFQLASFHPQYCFQGCEPTSAENYTNRSPFPMLHVLREQSLENALTTFKNPEQIPLRNIESANNKGVEFFEDILNNIMK